MIVKSFLDKILLNDKKDVLRIHLYLKFLQFGIIPHENDMNIIIELYCFGGYTDTQRQNEFFEICLNKRYRKSKQSLRNTLSKYTGLGVFKKTKNASLSVNVKYIPNVKFDKLLLQHTISHAT